MPDPANLAPEVAAPAFTRLPYGLLSAVELVDETDPHWAAGVRFRPDSCATGHVTQEPCPAADTGDDKTPSDEGIGCRLSEPFTVYAWVNCGPQGQWTDGEERARRALENNEARAVERAFWTGDVMGADGDPILGVVQPHLAASVAVTGACELQTAATNVVSGAPASGVPAVEALGLMEGALAACYGGLGVIHVPRWTLSTFAGFADQLVRTPTRVSTFGGTAVAAGAGYVGTGPDGTTPPAGSAWIYGTGAVALRRGPISAPTRVESLDRAKNDLVLIAERTYVVGWDCCHFALLVDVGTFTPPLVGA